jgi:hypothetical protein
MTLRTLTLLALSATLAACGGPEKEASDSAAISTSYVGAQACRTGSASAQLSIIHAFPGDPVEIRYMDVFGAYRVVGTPNADDTGALRLTIVVAAPGQGAAFNPVAYDGPMDGTSWAYGTEVDVPDDIGFDSCFYSTYQNPNLTCSDFHDCPPRTLGGGGVPRPCAKAPANCI